MKKFIEYTGYSNLPISKEVLEIDFSTRKNEIEHISITFDNKENKGIVIIKIDFTNDIEFELAKRIAEKKIDQIIKGIIFTSGIQVHGIEQTLHNFAEYKSGFSDHSMVLTVPFKFNLTQLDEIKSLTKSEKTNHVYYDLYRQAINHDDNLGKFMFLYSLLMLVLKTDYQSEVDKFIVKAKKDEKKLKQRSTKLIEQKDGTRKRSKRLETRFTWLRNQVGHTQEDSEITKAINEMKDCYKVLKEIVKQAIKENI
ncbi:hypothetical protein [Paenibacillus sp. SER-28]